MPTETANGDSRPSLWLRVREFAVPPSMIETATARRRAGDWAGACAAAGVDVDLHLRSVARTHGRELAVQVRADLRGLAPDLLRWHLPRIAPNGLLRPGLTMTLARYGAEGRDGPLPVHLVARTPPAWADAGQRISLALWDGSARGSTAWRHPHPNPHPHPHPNPRFRLDLHRHLWDARRAPELRTRSGADRPPATDRPVTAPAPLGPLPYGHRCAVDRWAAEAAILLDAEGRHRGSDSDSGSGSVAVRLGSRHRLRLDLIEDGDGDGDGDGGDHETRHGEGHGPGPVGLRISAAAGDRFALPVLPDAATWVLPDLELLRTGAIEAARLHPLVASALVPDRPPAGPSRPQAPAHGPHLVECRGARHRIGLVGGVLAALDHAPDEIRREELLAALTGTPLPCLRAIDEAHRRPDCLPGVRERLAHGDTAGALAVVEGLLGPGALLRSGDLRDELEAAALRRIRYGLFRSGLVGPGPGRIHPGRGRPREHRSHPRHTTVR